MVIGFVFRLTGIFALIILFHVSLLRYLPYGPVDLLSGIQVAMCQDVWWYDLLYVNNFFSEEGVVSGLMFHLGRLELLTLLCFQCIGQTWYLAVDMQLFWASPLMIWPLWWIHKKKGIKWALAWCVGWATVLTGVILTLHLVNDWPASSTAE